MTVFSTGVLSVMGVLFISCTSSMRAFEKRWIKSNSWDDPSNWNPPRLPCPNDKIVLKQDVVYIAKNVTIKSELTLPSDGEIIFGPNSNLIFEGNAGRSRRSVSSSCSQGGSEITFVGQRKKNWLNPMNWEIHRNGKKDEYLTKAAPYIERVPCDLDQVSFPKGDAFEVDIKEAITIKNIILNGQVIEDNVQFQSYLSTKEGKARFNFLTPGASLKLSSTNNCGHSVCKCGNDMLLKKICNNFECPKTCAKKVKPERGCCYRCGALITASIDHNFNIDECSGKLRTMLSEVKKSEVRPFASVRLYMYPIGSTNSKIQVLVSEDDNGTNAEEAAEYIQHYMENIPGLCGGMTNAKVEKHIQDDDEGSSKTTIVWAVILTIFLLALLIFVVTYFWKKRNPSVAKRQKFDNENDFTQFPGANDVHETDFTSPDLFPGTTQFANPLYECGGLDEVNELERNKNDEVASPEYAIPIDYFATKKVDDTKEEPRYVGGLSNPIYNLEAKFDPDDTEVDSGNTNPLYEVVMKEFPDKLSPAASVVDLDSPDDTDSINNLELKVKFPSDSEEDVKYEGMQVPVEEIDAEPAYSIIQKI